VGISAPDGLAAALLRPPRALAWLLGPRADARRALRRPGPRAAGLPARQELPDHLNLCAERVDVALCLRGDGDCRRVKPHLAHQARGRDAREQGADRRVVHLPRPGHGLAVEQADVGHLLGVGCAPDLRAGTALPLSRRHRVQAAGQRQPVDGLEQVLGGADLHGLHGHLHICC